VLVAVVVLLLMPVLSPMLLPPVLPQVLVLPVKFLLCHDYFSRGRSELLLPLKLLSF
jgi:hypothetical protein